MIKKNIPNLFTCANLFCGCLGIVFAFQGNLVWTAYMVGIAAIMDFLDGFVARLLNVHSEIGKQLDSLADMVTFGVVPGVVMFKLINGSALIYALSIAGDPDYYYAKLAWNTVAEPTAYLAFLITVFSAIRLAKFNIDKRQTDSFIGVPTPANAILICSLPLIIHEVLKPFYLTPSGLGVTDMTGQFKLTMASSTILNPWFLIGLTLIMSFLLVAELPLFALKFKNFSWADNKIRYIYLALCAAVLIIFKIVGIPFVIVLYVVLSVINNIISRKQ